MPNPSNLHMNWVNVSVTPNGLSTIAIEEVTAVQVGRSSRLEKFFGDNRRQPRMVKAVELQRSISITTGNTGILSAVPDDTPCTVTATLADPRNGVLAGGGAYTVTLVNAVLTSEGKEGQNNKFASCTLKFESFGASGDGGQEVDALSVVPV